MLLQRLAMSIKEKCRFEDRRNYRHCNSFQIKAVIQFINNKNIRKKKNNFIQYGNEIYKKKLFIHSFFNPINDSLEIISNIIKWNCNKMNSFVIFLLFQTKCVNSFISLSIIYIIRFTNLTRIFFFK